MFLDNQKDTAQSLLEALTAGDHKLAQQVLHGARGVAGNIGALALADSAQHLETLLREGSPAALITAATDDFDTLLMAQLSAMRVALAVESPPIAAPMG